MQDRNEFTPDFSRVAEAWEKWEDWLEPCYLSFNESLLALAGICHGQTILDLGCGSGQPAILESEIAGAAGSVTALDVSAAMIEVAGRRAASLKRENIRFLQKDMDTLPFEDASFDAVTARFSLMFIRNPEKTLREIYRVMKPNSRFACSVWAGTQENPIPRNVLREFVEVPDEDPSIPGPFRFSRKDSLPHLMKQAGFKQITQRKTVIGETFLSGLHYVQHLLEASALWGGFLLKLNPEQRKEAMDLLAGAAEANRLGDRVQVQRCAWIIAGTKRRIEP